MSGANGSNISVSDKYRQRRTLLVLRIRDNQTRDWAMSLSRSSRRWHQLLSSEATPQARVGAGVRAAAAEIVKHVDGTLQTGRRLGIYQIQSLLTLTATPALFQMRRLRK
jgi:hypothetical protein